jgi:predicted Holliday junction resolvase-like endonuclease
LYELEILETILILILTIIVAFVYFHYASLKGNIQAEARKTFENWRQSEFSAVKSQYESQLNTAVKQYENQLEEAKRQNELALEEKYKGLFSQWCQDKEIEIRQDAIARSQAVVLGRVTEHLAPYMPEFKLNPRDARFIGSPIDLVVFNGLTEGDLKSIVFVEIKSGESQITPRERKIRDIIGKGLIEWKEFRIQTAHDLKIDKLSKLTEPSSPKTSESTNESNL